MSRRKDPQGDPLEKKIQLRRCGSCNKPGHNIATCQETALVDENFDEIPSPPADQSPRNSTLKFFVHHVDYKTTPSPHILDLKNDNPTVWDKVTSAAPETEKTLFHSYHESMPQPQNTATEFLPAEKTLAPKINFCPVEKKQNIFTNLKNKFSAPPAEKPKECAPPIRAKINLSARPTSNFWPRLKSLFSLKKLATSLAALTLFVTVPGPARSYFADLKSLKAAVAQNSIEGFAALQDSASALKKSDWISAEKSTQNALEKFNQATATLENNHRLLQTLALAAPLLGDELASRQKILLAGQEIATGNNFLLTGLKKSLESKDLAGQLDIIVAHIKSALPNYQNAVDNLSTVDSGSLPSEYQNQFNDFQTLFAGLVKDFQNSVELGDSLKEIFGAEGRRRYLVVFQNPSELRPTGGFMGSLAIIEIKNGKIIKMDVPAGGSYDFQGQLDVFVEPPSPLLISNKRWEFQDANWFPDFPASAEKILWFYRHSRKVTADGVIAINASVLERMLGLMGPIKDAKRDLTISSDNALPLIQKMVE